VRVPLGMCFSASNRTGQPPRLPRQQPFSLLFVRFGHDCFYTLDPQEWPVTFD
jgi:hypothetical protein